MQTKLREFSIAIPPLTIFGEPNELYFPAPKPVIRKGLYVDREEPRLPTPFIEEVEEEEDNDENARSAFPNRRVEATQEDADQGNFSASMSGLTTLDMHTWAALQPRTSSPHPMPHRPLPTTELQLDTTSVIDDDDDETGSLWLMDFD